MRSMGEGACSGALVGPPLAALATSPDSQGSIMLLALPPDGRRG